MSVFFYAKSDVDRQAKLRPPGYLAALREAVVREDDRFLWIDTAHPAFVALQREHAGKPNAGLSAVTPSAPTHQPAADPAEAARKLAEQGRKQWAHLHRFCLTADARDPATLAAFLEAFEKGLPCGPCREHWKQILAADPPDPADPFGWSVRAHNAVNRKLGKPEVSRAAALSLWPDGPQTTGSPSGAAAEAPPTP